MGIVEKKCIIFYKLFKYIYFKKLSFYKSMLIFIFLVFYCCYYGYNCSYDFVIIMVIIKIIFLLFN